MLVQYAVIVTNQSFAGHLGANELAAAAIAVTVSILMQPSQNQKGFQLIRAKKGLP